MHSWQSSCRSLQSDEWKQTCPGDSTNIDGTAPAFLKALSKEGLQICHLVLATQGHLPYGGCCHVQCPSDSLHLDDHTYTQLEDY